MICRLLWSAVLATAVGFAQRGGGGRGGQGTGEDPGRMMAVQTRLDTIASLLQLNKDQKKTVKAILDDGQKEAAPLRDQISKTLLQIGEAVQEGKGQDALNQAVGSYSVLEAQMTAIEMRSFAKIYQLLEKDQQRKAGSLFLMIHGVFKGKNWNELE